MSGGQRQLCCVLLIALVSMAPSVSEATVRNAGQENMRQRQENAGKLLEGLKKGEYESAVGLFSDEMQAALPAERLKAVWEDIQKRVGPLRRIEGPSWLA